MLHTVPFTHQAADLQSRIEALSAENERLETWARMVLHDIRAPLRAMSELPGWITEDLIAHFGAIPGDIRRDLEGITEKCRQIDQMATDMLNQQQPAEVGKQRAGVDPTPLLTQSIAQAAVPDSFRIEIAPDLPRLHGNPQELVIVMRNLLANAVQHHDRPAGAIRVDGAVTSGHVILRFHDDGPGIAEGHHTSVWEMFTSHPSGRAARGSGIGLAFVQQSMRNVGGDARIEPSAFGRGTCIALMFPRKSDVAQSRVA